MSKKNKPIVNVEKDSKKFNVLGVVLGFLIINVVICWIPVAGISLSSGGSSNNIDSIENLDSTTKSVEAPDEGSSVLSTSDIDLNELLSE